VRKLFMISASMLAFWPGLSLAQVTQTGAVVTLVHSGDINMMDGSPISDFTLSTCHGHQ